MKHNYNFIKNKATLSFNKYNLKTLILLKFQWNNIKRSQKVLSLNRYGKKQMDIILLKGKQKTEYQKNHIAKQHLKIIYGNLNKKYLNKVSTLAKKNHKPLITLLEKRLDIVMFRAGFSKTIFESKQDIKENKVNINNIKVKSKSMILKEGFKVETNNLNLQYFNSYNIKIFDYKPYPNFKIIRKGLFYILNFPNEKDLLLPYSFNLIVVRWLKEHL